MLSLLTDAHVARAVAVEVRRHRPVCFIESIHDWEHGHYRDADDPLILEVAAVSGLTLLTYDQSTIMPELERWGAQGRSHSGVVFVDNHTIAQRDTGRLVRAVVRLWDEERDLDWRNRITYLARPQ